MTRRYALVRDGIVENVVKAAEGWEPPEGCELASDPDGRAVIGGTYAEGEFGAPPPPPPPPPPEAVSPLQLRRALRQAGLKPQVDALVATLDEETQEAWEYATEIRRDSPLIEMAIGALGLSDQKADDLFRAAATL